MKILVIGGAGCGYCVEAKRLLERKGKSFTYKDISEDGVRTQLVSSGFRTIPQIWIDDEHIGGYNELKEYLND